MLFDIISTIEIETTRYRYGLNQDGSRNIDTTNPEKETFVFKFDSISTEQIIFREGPPVLFVDDKCMYFNYKNNTLAGIHFENNDYIWILKDYKDFINQCREAYLRQKITERFLGIMDQTNPSGVEKIDHVIDEFDKGDVIITDEFEEDGDGY